MDFSQARKLMVINQLKPNNIKNGDILDLFMNVSKDSFLPNEKKLSAYNDNEIHLIKERYYLSNLQIAKMINYSNFAKSDKVLHIGALTGYVSILISKLVSKVFSIESDNDLFEQLKTNINNNKITNIELINSKHENGYNKSQPYDVIFIDSVTELIPDDLYNQLNNNNGRLVTIERINSNLGKGIQIIKNNDSFMKKIIFDSFSKSISGFKKNIEFIF